MGVPVYVGDRVLVTTSTVGIGTYSIDATAVGGYLTPANAQVTSGSYVAYVVVDSLTNPSTFEIGEGTYTAGSPSTVTRALIIRNSSGGTSAINWSVGTKYLFLAPSATRFVMYDSDGGMTLNTHITLVSGAAASVSISTPGDRNTGLFFPGPDRVALATNGSTRLEFNATGAALFNDSHGTSGQVLRTNGSTAAPTWVSVFDLGVVNKAGDTLTGALYASGAAGVYGSAGTSRAFHFRTNSQTRFQFDCDFSAETGSNAGSNLWLYAFDDSGIFLGNVFEITRSTRKLDFKVNPSINGSDVVKKSDYVTNASSTGSTAMPSGIILKWGSGSTSNGAGSVTFASAFPAACYNVSLTITGGDGAQSLSALKVGTYSATGFNAYGPAGTSYGFFWQAIGA